jgi:hypothetical protein
MRSKEHFYVCNEYSHHCKIGLEKWTFQRSKEKNMSASISRQIFWTQLNNMERKKLTYRYTPNLPILCSICGDKARGNNFSVLSCVSCKSFFRRHGLLDTVCWFLFTRKRSINMTWIFVVGKSTVSIPRSLYYYKRDKKWLFAMSIEEMYRKWYGPIEDPRSNWNTSAFEENSAINSNNR